MPIPAAIFEEFPFLSKHFKEKSIFSAYVRRWNSELLETSPAGRNPNVTWEQIYLFDKEGKLIHRVGQIWWGGTRHIKVGQWLAKLGSDINRVHYAVVHESKVLTVYKPPQGFASVAEWLRAQMKREVEAG